MKKITQTELNSIIEKHNLWLNQEEGGQKAVDYWKQYKNIIKQMIELSPATPTKGV